MAAGIAHFNVDVRIDQEFASLVSERLLVEAAQATVRGEDLNGRTSMGLTITGDDTVRELNASYRSMDTTTDVLSFSYPAQHGPPTDEADQFLMPPGEEAGVGEVVVSYPQARRQAEDAGVPVDEEIAHLITHGTLHLLGYDHDDPVRDQAMRARESAVLGRLFNKPGPASEE
jgi:probable rRNA maturation factor